MNARTLTTIGGGVIGGAAGRKFGAWEVANFFPHFHETHGYDNEIAGTFFGVLAGGVVVNVAMEIAQAIARKRKNKQTNVSQG